MKNLKYAICRKVFETCLKFIKIMLLRVIIHERVMCATLQLQFIAVICFVANYAFS